MVPVLLDRKFGTLRRKGACGMNYLEELNPQQKEAAVTTEGYLRVVAGAGSGKTKTLTARYLY